MKSGFLDKLVARIDRIDPASLQGHFLRLAQEKGLLETIFASIQEGVIVLDGDGKLSYANRAAERLLGFSLEDMEGKAVSRIVRDINWERILALASGEWSKLINSELEVDYPEHRFISFYVVPLNTVRKGERGAVLILRDVTADRERTATQIESEKMNALKLLASGVAHEIGNPLNALNIHLQLLDRELKNLSEDVRGDLGELVDVAKKEVTRLDLIITQFLSAIRPSRPKLVRAQVANVLNETLNLLKQEIEGRQIQVEVDRPSRLPRIHIDRDQMKQAFFNVIKNALQAMPDGGSLNISLSGSDRGVAISFQDNGTGISPEEFPKMFEPYHTTKSDGSGLGLMIVQRIIQDHGGQMEVTSEPDTGTTFTLFLPAADRRMRLLKSPQAAQEHLA